jgi:hypothetical protein
MPLKLNVGASRKIGLPDYGSVGASCNLEMELDSALLERDLDGFHARVRDAFIAARQAVHDELARVHVQAPIEFAQPAAAPSAPVNGRSNGTGHANSGPPERSRSRKATEKQVKAIQAIARQQHADLDGLLQDFGVQRPEDLSLKQASELIDTLKTASRI